MKGGVFLPSGNRPRVNSGAVPCGKGELRVGPPALLWAAGVFSVGVNLLMLTGPIYMVQVYDHVLASRSMPTLMALSALALGLFVALGLLDHARARILARIGARLQHRLQHRVMAAALRRQALVPDDPLTQTAVQDLESVQRLWSAPVMVTVFDLPWSPLFLLVLFAFGAPLGWLALFGVAGLAALTLAANALTAPALHRAQGHLQLAKVMSQNLRLEAGVIGGLGMSGSAVARWVSQHHLAQSDLGCAMDRTGAFAAASRCFRMVLQSATLALGAWLVLQDSLSGGAMLAGSVLLGRCLQPVEQIIGQWPLVTRGLEARSRLILFLSNSPPLPPRLPLPRPAPRLEVVGMTVFAPGAQRPDAKPVLRNIGLRLQPGQTMGIIGPCGCGKSSLAQAVAGIWPLVAGSVRLGGASPDQFAEDGYGRLIGYLPQQIALFQGTIAENIARLDETPDPGAIIAAAQKAGVHEVILRLPMGYDTPLSVNGAPLSGGQARLISLARAFYGNPVLLILDEPTAGLDDSGTQAVSAALRLHKQGGGISLVMAHQAAALTDCDFLMVLEQGQTRLSGPRDAVLKELVRPGSDHLRRVAAGGMA